MSEQRSFSEIIAPFVEHVDGPLPPGDSARDDRERTKASLLLEQLIARSKGLEEVDPGERKEEIELLKKEAELFFAEQLAHYGLSRDQIRFPKVVFIDRKKSKMRENSGAFFMNNLIKFIFH